MRNAFIIANLFLMIFPSSFFGKTPQINWSEWEIPYTDAEKEKMISEMINENEHLPDDISNYHVIDLNNDNQADIIFNGDTGQYESDVCFISFKDPKGYQNVLITFGRITNLLNKPGSDVISVEIDQYPCCDGYIGFICLFEFNKTELQYQIVRRDLYYSYIAQWPDQYLKESVAFIVETPNAELLARPLETDEVLAPTSGDAVLKNGLFLLSENTKGQIMATYNADDGERYYFVKVDFAYVAEKLNPFYYHEKDTANLSVLGWVNSKRIILLND